MIHCVKRMVQRPLIKKRHRLYEERIAAQAVPYEVWLKSILGEERAEISDWKKKAEENGEELPVVKIMAYDELADGLAGLEGDEETEFFLFACRPEHLVKEAGWQVGRYFLEHPDCSIAYGDEDGWFKPDWSPELLQSFFYFGNVFAVRRECLRSILGEKNRNFGTEQKRKLYELVLNCIDEVKEAGHIEKILYMTEKEDDAEKDWGMEQTYAAVKKGHIYSDAEIPAEKEEQELISVIIPSKDNPAMLSKCIHSLRERTEYKNIEIIVIDNGSSEKNKNYILQMQHQLKEEFSFQYLYVSMEFNFSVMCNMGAERAKGKYLLFLNDDMEIVREDWLSVMMKRAAKDYAGAVGIKLLYPGADKIQHVGVTSIHLGPAHKLQFSSDEKTYYHGYNRCAINVSAVTGACLLVRKKVFEEAGGFSEKLKVSFNDVEFCFHLQKLGYRNICCNDSFLYHHESVSRGADFGLEKVKRLHQERDLLYSMYPEMWNHDRYYSRRLVTDILDKGYEAAYRFEEKRVSQKAQVQQFTGELPVEWHNECLYTEFEFTGDAQMWKTGCAGSGDYYIQGYSYAVDIDNSRYERSLLLKPASGESSVSGDNLILERSLESGGKREQEEIWKIPYTACYRPDMEENLSYLDHAALSGISIWIERNALPEGEYFIGSLWEDTCSRQKLYRFTEEILTIEKARK